MWQSTAMAHFVTHTHSLTSDDEEHMDALILILIDSFLYKTVQKALCYKKGIHLFQHGCQTCSVSLNHLLVSSRHYLLRFVPWAARLDACCARLADQRALSTWAAVHSMSTKPKSLLVVI